MPPRSIVGASLTALLLTAACHGTPHELSAPGQPLRPCPSTPNCVSSEATDSVHAMQGVPFSIAPHDAQVRARSALLRQPRTRITLDVPGYLRAEATSRIFRFVDDVEIVVDTAAMRFRFRSASRIGRGDRGVNRARMTRVSEWLRGATP
ncbi:MAG: DUF1499 domain-containing protein [Gemmatimonadaceae bacterium]